MVRVLDLSGIPDNPPPLVTLGQDNFSRGVISLIDESKLPRNALKKAENITLAEDGAPKVRAGVGWYGTDIGHTIDGADMFVTSTEAVHLLAVANGSVYRSTDDGVTWQICSLSTSATNVFTPGKKAGFEQANAYMYIFNGYDNIVRYDGTTTLATYTGISTPNANTPTKVGLAGTAYTYRYRVAAVNDIGYTIASTVVTSGAGWIQTDRQRDGFSETNYVSFTWTPVVGAVRYDIYVGQIAGEEVYLDSVEGQATSTYLDKGQAVEQSSVVAPDSNTTQGPRCGDMALIGSRLYATRDRDFPYRIWISGAGRFIGMFSSAYDATYLDWQKGGQHRPVKVEDYRDGKGTPLATIWCKSTDGRGSVLQGTLEAYTVGDVTFPVPNFYKLPGSRGTDAPYSVVNVLNDYMYYNSQAFYNLGSRAQFLNLLSTDESSANIRPHVKQINPAAADKIAGHFQDAKVLMSVPYGTATENSHTIQFDTERKAWLPEHMTLGFERFFAYTDTSGSRHTLCWKPGDSQLSEISDSIKGDYGEAFETNLITPLFHINPKNRFDWLWCEEFEFEFAQPQGTINVELSGITREDGYRKIDDKNIEPESTKHSWGLYPWSTIPWSYTDTEVVSYSEPSTKRFFTVQEEINAWQGRVSTHDLNADYILRTLQINGTGTQAGKPSEWELFE